MSLAVITGGSRGLGRATALKFAENGHDVALTYQGNVAAANETVNAIESLGQPALALQMNLDAEAEIDRAFDRIEDTFGQIDYLFNNAGILNDAAEMHEQTWTSWQRILTVDVIGQWHCACRARRNMLVSGAGGAILYCSSISGVMAFPMASDYAAAKHAVVGMAKAQALECAPYGIRVNSICPGFLATDMFETSFGDAAQSLADDLIPASRIASAEEIASLAYWVLVEGSYCYGSHIVADGGITAGPKHQPP